MPHKRKKSPYWWTSFTDANGKRVRRSLGTTNRKEANALESKWKLEAYRTKQWDEQPERSFSELMLCYLKATNRKRSHRRDLDAARHLKAFFRGQVMEKLKSSNIRAYQEYRLGQVSKKGPIQPATVNRETALLSSAINYARREWDWDIPNPVVGRLLQEPEGRVRHLSLSELAMLIRLAQAHTPHLADFIELGVQTGCRKQELLGLEWDRVDFDNNRFYLEGQHTKSGKRRSIPLNDRARLALERRRLFREQYCPTSCWVFSHECGDRIQDVKRSFRTVCDKAGIKDFRIHDLRHTCASLAISEGVPLAAIRDLLGHSSITVTERYAHLAPERVQDVVAVLDRITSHSGHTVYGDTNARRTVRSVTH